MEYQVHIEYYHTLMATVMMQIHKSKNINLRSSKNKVYKVYWSYRNTKLKK